LAFGFFPIRLKPRTTADQASSHVLKLMINKSWRRRLVTGAGFQRQEPTLLQPLVPRAGIEPTLPIGKRILSPLRLPVPPPGHLDVGCSLLEDVCPGYAQAQCS
jgi:hypothetical protein